MKSFTPKLVVDNKNKDLVRDLSQFFYVKNSKISAENLEKLSEHFNTSIEKKVHPWGFEKNLDDQLKGADRVHFLYLYYLIYINAVHEDIFYGLLNDGCDGSYAKLFRRDEQNNPLALQVFKYNILGFNLINGSKEEPIKELEEFAEYTFDEAMFNTKSDNLPLLLKAWKACQEKFLLEDKEKLKAH